MTTGKAEGMTAPRESNLKTELIKLKESSQMIKGKKLNEILINDTSKYILNTWNEFTTLTEQEEENLKEIKDFIKLFRTKKKRQQKKINFMDTRIN